MVSASTTALYIPIWLPRIFAFGIAVTGSVATLILYPLSIASFSLRPTLENVGCKNAENAIGCLSSKEYLPLSSK